MIEYQLAYILDPNDTHYRSIVNGELVAKDKYKVNPQRSIIFEGEN